MGSTTFSTFHACDTSEVSPQEAFDLLVAEATLAHGNSGYTGTIAEKTSFRTLASPSEDDLVTTGWADSLLTDDSTSFYDTDGPAACVKLSNGWYFCGWARE